MAHNFCPPPSSRGACLALAVGATDDSNREVSSAFQGLPVVLSLNQLEAHEGRGLEYQVPPPGTPLPHSSVQLLSRVLLFAAPWTVARQVSLSITNSRSLLKLMSIESVMPSNHLILRHLLLLLPSIFPSIGVFSNESVLRTRWPEYWSFSFSFSISPSNEYSGLISSRMDWLDLLAVQGTLKSLLQHHSLKASILWSSAFFMVQLSHPYVTTGKTIALTVWAFVSKVMPLLFNTLSRFVIAFLPRSNCP